ncbi:hypothetical protein A2U01_0075252, partial [Trifolium medium]|nr:hypothetical protein [Trifolium medium]
NMMGMAVLQGEEVLAPPFLSGLNMIDSSAGTQLAVVDGFVESSPTVAEV